MNNYIERVEARKERLLNYAHTAETKADQLYKSGHDKLACIPFGQPILVGHHSERADRSYRTKAFNQIEKSFELSKKAESLKEKAETIGTGGISSDNPDALNLLKAKLEKLEDQRKEYKEFNRKAKAEKSEILASFYLSNLGASIRTAQKRIEQLEKLQSYQPAPDVIGQGYVLTENKDVNRIQFIFDGKPTENIRAELKKRGFRWSPYNSAWQIGLHNRGRYLSKEVAEYINKL